MRQLYTDKQSPVLLISKHKKPNILPTSFSIMFSSDSDSFTLFVEYHSWVKHSSKGWNDSYEQANKVFLL